MVEIPIFHYVTLYLCALYVFISTAVYLGNSLFQFIKNKREKKKHQINKEK